MSTSEEQWVEAVQKIGSAKLTHPSKEGRTARQELALVLWKAAMKGDMKASTLILKYDLGIEVEEEASSREHLGPVTFAREALGFEPDDWQVEALSWTARKAVWLCNRQAGKSTTAAILGLHTALYKPKALVLLVSPSLRQSKELYRKVVDFIRGMDNPPKLVEDTKTACEFRSGSRIVCLPGTEATVRGYSAADLIIEDEASRVADAFNNAIRPMLAVSGGRIVLLSTPYGKRGHFYTTWTGSGGGWHRIKTLATECSRITPEFLQDELDEIGQWWYDQEYLCVFQELVDAFFTSKAIEATFTSKVEPFYDAEFLASVHKEEGDA